MICMFDIGDNKRNSTFLSEKKTDWVYTCQKSSFLKMGGYGVSHTINAY